MDSRPIDRRARLKSVIRRYPVAAKVAQWVFDPAYTPNHLLRSWVNGISGRVLNFGSGSRDFGRNTINLDIEPTARVHVVNLSDHVPFQDNSFEGVLLEYVLEHVPNSAELLKECRRVLKPGGAICATVPFKQNYHACPNDYLRLTHEGLETLFRAAGFTQITVAVYGGPASAWIDATKEFLATILSFGSTAIFEVLTQLLIIPFIPLRYLDVLLRRLPMAKFTAFSFVVTANAPGELSVGDDRPLSALIKAPAGYDAVMRNGLTWIEPARKR